MMSRLASSSLPSPTLLRHKQQSWLPLGLAVCLGAFRFFAIVAGLTLLLSTFGIDGLPYLYLGLAIVSALFPIIWERIEQQFRLHSIQQTLAQTSSFGNSVTAVLGSIITPFIVLTLGMQGLVGTAVFCLLLTLIILLYGQRERAFIPAPKPAPPQKLQTKPLTLSKLFQERYIRLYALTILLAAISYLLIDSLYLAILNTIWPDSNQIAIILGLVLGLSGLFALLNQTVLIEPLCKRLNIRKLILIPPLIGALLLGSLFIAANGTEILIISFILLVALKLNGYALQNPTAKAAQPILLQPCAMAQREQLPARLHQIVQPLAAGFSGLLLWFILNTNLTIATQLWGITAALIFIFWIISSLLLGRAYPKILLKAVTNRHLMGDDGAPLALDTASLQTLKENLHSPHTAVVLYAFDTLVAAQKVELNTIMPQMINHETSIVRLHGLNYIAQHEQISLLPMLQERLAIETDNDVRSVLIRILAQFGRDDLPLQMSPYLTDAHASIRQSSMIGMLRSGNLEATIIAGQTLLQAVHATDAKERRFAAQVLEAIGVSTFYQVVRQLLADEDILVQQAAINAAGHIQNPYLWPYVLEKLSNQALRGAALAALAKGGTAVSTLLPPLLAQASNSADETATLLKLCGRLGDKQAIALLLRHCNHPQEGVREQALQSLHQCHYRATGTAVHHIEQFINKEIAHAIWLLAVWNDLQTDEAATILEDALREGVADVRNRLFYYLSFIYGANHVLHIQSSLQYGDAAKQAVALQSLELMLPPSQAALLMPLLANLTTSQQWQQLQSASIQPVETVPLRLEALICGNDKLVSPWLKACALFVAAQGAYTQFLPSVRALQSDQNALVQETAVWAAHHLDSKTKPTEEDRMLSTIERVIILKSASIFTSLPDKTLAQVAPLLEEIDVPAGQTVFNKGDIGNSLYIIVRGELQVHDDAFLINTLSAGELFGEMAVLDAAPRMASITAVSDTHLLQLGQEPLYELIESHTEIGRSIIQVLSRRLRQQTQTLKKQQTTT